MRDIIGWLTADVGAAMRNLIWKTKPNTCVEIGVFAGKSLINTALALKENGHGVVYGIDPWKTDVALANLSSDEKESAPEYWSGIDLDAVHWDCMRAIWQRDLEDYVVIIRSSSEKCYQLFPMNSVDILYIDGGHSEECSTVDTALYLPSVKSGGHIWLDDTNYVTLQKAVSLVEKQCQLVKDFGHARLYRKI
jgi:hypothetical protein